MTDPGRQRIDKWLWFARVVKTRALAQDLAASGHVRLNGRKVDAPAQPVKIGDVLTIGLRGGVRVFRVTGFAERRGSAPEARALYDDLAPPAPKAADPADPSGSTDPDAGDDEDDGEGSPAPARPVPPPRSDAPRAVRGAGRPTKRDRRRFGRVPDGGAD